MVYPVIDTFAISAYSWNRISADRIYVGLRNWKTIGGTDPSGRPSAIMWSSWFSILLQIPLGMLLATFLDAGGRNLIFLKPYGSFHI